MIRVEMTYAFPVSVSKAFTYICNMDNWIEYWPGFVCVYDKANAKWAHSGDTIKVITKFLSRERELYLKLEEFQKDKIVTYVSQQKGLPDARHERHFKENPEGCEYRLVVCFEPRKGLMGLIDRIFIQRAVTNALHQTVMNLDTIFRNRPSKSGISK